MDRAKTYISHTPQDLERLAGTLWQAIVKSQIVGLTLYLSGDLGAGKTTFVRGFLRAMGYLGTVKSPTYTLVEPYELLGRSVFHFDLYRLEDPIALEGIGIRDYFNEHALCLVEWPEKGGAFLPTPDLTITILPTNDYRTITITAMNSRGQDVFKACH